MIYRAGRLKENVELQEPVDVPDGKGGQARVWVTVETRRAEKLSKGTKSFHALQQRYMTLTEAFRMREVQTNPEWRLLHDGQAYRIVGVELMDRETLLITEKEQRTKTYGH